MQVPRRSHVIATCQDWLRGRGCGVRRIGALASRPVWAPCRGKHKVRDIQLLRTEVMRIERHSISPPGAQAIELPTGAHPEGSFYIPATGPASRPRRALKYGDTFVVVAVHGDIGASAGGPDGLFHADTRFLSRLEFLLNGLQPLLLGSNLRDDNALLAVDLTNPDVYVDNQIVLHKDTVHVIRTIFLWRNTAYQRLAIRNYGSHALDLRLTIVFDSDFADFFEVRGMRRERRGVAKRYLIGSDKVRLTYLGLDGEARHTTLSFDPPPTELTINMASYRLRLLPGEAKPIFFGIACNQRIDEQPKPFLRGLRTASPELRAATPDITTVRTSNDIFN